MFIFLSCERLELGFLGLKETVSVSKTWRFYPLAHNLKGQTRSTFGGHWDFWPCVATGHWFCSNLWHRLLCDLAKTSFCVFISLLVYPFPDLNSRMLCRVTSEHSLKCSVNRNIVLFQVESTLKENNRLYSKTSPWNWDINRKACCPMIRVLQRMAMNPGSQGLSCPSRLL